MKAYTDLEQSKKLAKILPLESADMNYWCGTQIRIGGHRTMDKDLDIPCWSLSVLLDVLHYPQLSKDKLGSGKAGWMVSAYPNDCRHDSCWHDNPVDACYEMILKLNELKML